MLYNTHRGFTLLEILIAVLIIGVLAAIAVPQYQKAVLKSRFSSLMPTTKAIRDGQEMYYMTNGRYANAVNKLDVTATNNSGMTITLSDDSDYAYTMATRPNIKNNLIMYQKHSTNYPGEIHCEALKGNTQAKWLCETGLKAVQNLGENITPNYTTYVLEGTGTGMPYWAKDIDCDKAISMGISCQAVRNAYGVGRQMCIKGVCRTIYENKDGSYTSITCQVNSRNVCTGSWRSVTYDANGNMLMQRDCSRVDNSGKCTRYTVQTGTYEYTYDANGNMLTKRECKSVNSSNGKCTSYGAAYDYTYDANGNQLTYARCATVNNSNGKCTSYKSGGEYTYDANGNRLTQRTCSSVDSSNGKCTSYSSSINYYTYDANGNLLTERYCSSVDSSGNCKAYYSYGNYNYTYDANGKMLTQRTCDSVNSNGNCTSYSSKDAYNYTYDTNGNVLTQQVCSSVDSSGKCTSYSSNNAYNYTYDTNGNMLTKRFCNSSNTDSSGNCTQNTVDYTYDANGNQLTKRYCSSVDSSGKCTWYSSNDAYDYTYDTNGNMLTQRKCWTVDNSNGKCTLYDNAASQYDYTYDDNGKQIAQQSCYGNNINTSTGECRKYNSTSVSAN